MKQINCNMIQDLLPLYQEGLVSGQTKKEIDEHLQRCPQCRAVQEKNQQELFHQTDLLSNTNSKEKSALVLLKKIQKSQNSTWYFTVILSMLVADYLSLLYQGWIGFVPCLILIPFLLTLLFHRYKAILIFGALEFLMVSTVQTHLILGLIGLPFFLFCAGSGIMLAKQIQLWRKKGLE